MPRFVAQAATAQMIAGLRLRIGLPVKSCAVSAAEPDRAVWACRPPPTSAKGSGRDFLLPGVFAGGKPKWAKQTFVVAPFSAVGCDSRGDVGLRLRRGFVGQKLASKGQLFADCEISRPVRGATLLT